jgi:hypothetical protein
MEIGESFFWKNHGKLAHLRNLAPKIIYENNSNNSLNINIWYMLEAHSLRCILDAYLGGVSIG